MQLLNNKPAVRGLIRLALCAALAALFLVVGFYLMIVAAFSGSSFYYILFWLAYPLLTIPALVFIGFKATRRYAKCFYIVLGLCIVVPVSVRATYLHFDNKVAVLYDGVDLVDYQPFSPALPRLKEQSQLTLTQDLPVLDGALALYPVYSAFATAVYPEKSYALRRAYTHNSTTAYYSGANTRLDSPYIEAGDTDENGEPAKEHEVHFTNTVTGFQGLLDGRVDIYFMAEISDQQKALAREKGIELVYTPIGREVFVFFVNAENTVDDLTIEQIKGIYSGKITSWANLGGKGTIKPFQRNKNSGSQSALEHLMQGEEIIEPPTTEQPAGMGGIIRQVASYKNYTGAIGFSFRFFSTHMAANNQIKLIKINGTAPTKENIANGSYPLAYNFYAITRKQSTPNVQKMLDFITSEQGQYLVEQVGYVPVKAQ